MPTGMTSSAGTPRDRAGDEGRRIVEPSKNGGGSGCQDGVSNDVYQGPPYVERKFQYAESNNAPRVIDPSQVDYILVCGVRIDMPQ